MTGLEITTEKMLQWCSQRGWNFTKQKLILGVSGGSDSVAMSQLFAFLRERMQLKLFILHINHHLRGKDSVKDERFVHNLADDLGIDFIKHDLNPPKHSIEENCRKLRYQIYEKYANELDADVLLAHTANDQTETLIFNLFRGTGPRGLAGMPAERKIGKKTIIRPLLFSTREMLVELLEELGEKWREDISNQDESFSRNYIRRLVIPPLLEKFGDGSIERILNTTLVQREFVERVEKSILRYYKKLPYDIYIIYNQICNYKHAGIFGEVIRQIIDDMGEGLGRFSDELVKRLLETTKSSRTELFDDIFFENYRHFSIIYQEKYIKNLKIRCKISEGVNHLGDYGTLELERLDDKVHICNREGSFSAHFAMNEPEKLYLATPDPGELITPYKSSERKFTQFARDRNIPRFLRNSVPVLYNDAEPVWAIGLGIANEYKIQPQKKFFYKASFKGDWMNLINNFKTIS
ncbi:MAG: tRNA lysidine(34) synthetase TilS [Candidatus Zixiibacteriota bacterium]